MAQTIQRKCAILAISIQALNHIGNSNNTLRLSDDNGEKLFELTKDLYVHLNPHKNFITRNI